MLPTDPAIIDAYLQRATPEERAEIMALLEADMEAAVASPGGRQSEAADSEADITGYGGAAGGGKTDLIAGLCLTEHQRSVIFRREKAQTEGIVQRMTEILGSTDGYNSQKSIWRTTVAANAAADRVRRSRQSRRPSEVAGTPARPEGGRRSYRVPRAPGRFVMGWNRTSDPKQRTRAC
jgi:hypothetical protein